MIRIYSCSFFESLVRFHRKNNSISLTVCITQRKRNQESIQPISLPWYIESGSAMTATFKKPIFLLCSLVALLVPFLFLGHHHHWRPFKCPKDDSFDKACIRAAVPPWPICLFRSVPQFVQHAKKVRAYLLCFFPPSFRWTQSHSLHLCLFCKSVV